MTRMKPNTPMKRLFAVLAACAGFLLRTRGSDSAASLSRRPRALERDRSCVDRRSRRGSVQRDRPRLLRIPAREGAGRRTDGQLSVRAGGTDASATSARGSRWPAGLATTASAASALRYRMPNGHHEIPVGRRARGDPHRTAQCPVVGRRSASGGRHGFLGRRTSGLDGVHAFRRTDAPRLFDSDLSGHYDGRAIHPHGQPREPAGQRIRRRTGRTLFERAAGDSADPARLYRAERQRRGGAGP